VIDRAELERTLGALDGSHATDATISLQDWSRADVEAGRVATALSLPPLALELPDGPGRRDERADLEVRTLLGRGGMGQVFAAHQRTLQREVAVKSVRADAPPNAERALVAEAMLMGHLEHPGIVPVHALGAAGDGRPALVMKRVEGVAWRALIRDPEHPHWARLGGADEGRLAAHLRVLQRVCDAVHFANERGVVHRDIKPDNVMVGAWGEVWILDWGVAVALPGARITLPEAAEPPAESRRRVVGTPGYMAPEMALCDTVDARTDVYLLGATLHEVLTGEIRHPGVNLLASVWHAAQSEPFAYGPDVPDDLAALCNDATARDPARRPQTALAFRQRLDAHLRHRGARALLAATDRKLEALRAVAEGASAAERVRVYELLAACRFGYEEAARSWPANPRSAAGEREAVLAAIRYDVAVGELDGARSLAAGAGELPPDVTAALDALAAERARRDEEARRLEQLRRDQDASLLAGPRAWIFAAMLATALATSGLRELVVRRGLVPEAPAVVAAPFVALAAHAAIVGAFRKVILANAFGRRLIAGLMLAVLTTGLSHALGYAFGVPLAAAYTYDLLMWATMSAALAVTMLPWFGWVAAVAGAGALVGVIAPERARAAFVAVQLAVALIGARRIRRGG